MSITTYYRPGVYSEYDLSGVVYGGSRGGLVGLAAVNAVAQEGSVSLVTGYEQAVRIFGNEGEMAKLAGLALCNGAGGVVCVPVKNENGYEAAFALLDARDDITAVICDNALLAVHQKLRGSVEQASAARRERVAVVGVAEDESVEAMCARADALNSERVVLVGPGGLNEKGESTSGICLAACVAGVLAGERDPAIPLGGAELKGVSGLSRHLTDGETEQLLFHGVTPMEQLGGKVSVVRGVTTRTATDGVRDETWQDLCTVRVIDRVIPGIRNSLHTKFRRAKNTPRGRGAIRAQVVLELENFLKQEIITAYDGVTVTADETDPTRALVEFSFTVAHGLNQIWLSAHITV